MPWKCWISRYHVRQGIGRSLSQNPLHVFRGKFLFLLWFPKETIIHHLPCQTVLGETDSANFLLLLCVAEGRPYVLAREEDSDSMDPLDDFFCDGVSRVCCLLINAVQSRP